METADLSQYDLMAGAFLRDIRFARAEELYKDAASLCACPSPSSMRTKAKAAARRMPHQRDEAAAAKGAGGFVTLRRGRYHKHEKSTCS